MKKKRKQVQCFARQQVGNMHPNSSSPDITNASTKQDYLPAYLLNWKNTAQKVNVYAHAQIPQVLQSPL